MPRPPSEERFQPKDMTGLLPVDPHDLVEEQFLTRDLGKRLGEERDDPVVNRRIHRVLDDLRAGPRRGAELRGDFDSVPHTDRPEQPAYRPIQPMLPMTLSRRSTPWFPNAAGLVPEIGVNLRPAELRLVVWARYISLPR